MKSTNAGWNAPTRPQQWRGWNYAMSKLLAGNSWRDSVLKTRVVGGRCVLRRAPIDLLPKRTLLWYRRTLWAGVIASFLATTSGCATTPPSVSSCPPVIVPDGLLQPVPLPVPLISGPSSTTQPKTPDAGRSAVK